MRLHRPRRPLRTLLALMLSTVVASGAIEHRVALKSAGANKTLTVLLEYLRMGANDALGWARMYQPSVDMLTRAGVDLSAKLLPNTGHVFPMTWDDLDPWLTKVREAAKPRPLGIPANVHREKRTWHSKSGASIEASLVRVSGGRAVLKKTDGDHVAIEIERLAETDRAYLESLSKNPDGRP